MRVKELVEQASSELLEEKKAIALEMIKSKQKEIQGARRMLNMLLEEEKELLDINVEDIQV